MTRAEKIFIVAFILVGIIWFVGLGVITFNVVFLTSFAIWLKIIAFAFLLADLFCMVVFLLVFIKYLIDESKNNKK